MVSVGSAFRLPPKVAELTVPSWLAPSASTHEIFLPTRLLAARPCCSDSVAVESAESCSSFSTWVNWAVCAMNSLLSTGLDGSW